jgi:uncharacterized protein YdeI (YjbR/CyaY-like superfamily)
MVAVIVRGTVPTPADITYFATPAELCKWFKAHHRTAQELWIGFHKRDSGRPSVTWQESVDEALCVGWIDGIRKRIDARRYTIRFSPRRETSAWSAVNIKRMNELVAGGRVLPAGDKAFAARRENRSGTYSYEQRPQGLEAPYAAMLRTHKKASAFFEAQPPGYRKMMGWFIVSARREETRLERLKKLIDACEKGRRLA